MNLLQVWYLVMMALVVVFAVIAVAMSDRICGYAETVAWRVPPADTHTSIFVYVTQPAVYVRIVHVHYTCRFDGAATRSIPVECAGRNNRRKNNIGFPIEQFSLGNNRRPRTRKISNWCRRRWWRRWLPQR